MRSDGGRVVRGLTESRKPAVISEEAQRECSSPIVHMVPSLPLIHSQLGGTPLTTHTVIQLLSPVHAELLLPEMTR